MTAPSAASPLIDLKSPSNNAEPRNEPVGIAFHDIGRRYGTMWALRKVTLRVSPGEFVLFRGPNGSGKSTLLKVAATLVRPSVGRVEYLGGVHADADAAKPRIGYVAHSTLLYDELSAAENLQLFGRLYGLPSLQSRVVTALDSVGLADRRDHLVRTFSRGMRQRLSLARALLHRPGLLLLDEPMTGLDQEARAWLERTLGGLRDTSCTVLMSTHAEEAAELATRTVWLHAGQVVHDFQGGAAAHPRGDS